MAELKYRFNPQTLNFERIRLSAGRRRSACCSLCCRACWWASWASSWLPVRGQPEGGPVAPGEPASAVQYELLNKRLSEVETVLGDVRRRDDNIYRVIFEADPLPASMRQAGSAG
jgi:hypothetical protein